MGARSRHGATPPEWLSHREKVTFLVGGKRQHYSQTEQTTLVLLGRILRADFGVGVASE